MAELILEVLRQGSRSLKQSRLCKNTCVSSLSKFHNEKCKIFAPPGCHEGCRGLWTSHDHRVTWLCFWRKWQLALQHMRYLLYIYVLFYLFYSMYMPTVRILMRRWDDRLNLTRLYSERITINMLQCYFHCCYLSSML